MGADAIESGRAGERGRGAGRGESIEGIGSRGAVGGAGLAVERFGFLVGGSGCEDAVAVAVGSSSVGVGVGVALRFLLRVALACGGWSSGTGSGAGAGEAVARAVRLVFLADGVGRAEVGGAEAIVVVEALRFRPRADDVGGIGASGGPASVEGAGVSSGTGGRSDAVLLLLLPLDEALEDVGVDGRLSVDDFDGVVFLGLVAGPAEGGDMVVEGTVSTMSNRACFAGWPWELCSDSTLFLFPAADVVNGGGRTSSTRTSGTATSSGLNKPRLSSPNVRLLVSGEVGDTSLKRFSGSMLMKFGSPTASLRSTS